jgi:hypothetical protein
MTDTASIGASVLRTPTRRALRGIALWVVTVVAGLALSGGSAMADDCPNAALRAQNGSSGLPDCRAYELVTPAFKEGFGPESATYTDGDAIGYVSTGNFSGNGMGAGFNQYVARRTATGWQTVSYNPGGPAWAPLVSSGAEALSADLGSSLWRMRRADQSTELLDYYVRDPDGVFTRVGPALNPANSPPGAPGTDGFAGDFPIVRAVSQDLSHVVFAVTAGPGQFPGDTSGLGLYEYVGTNNDRPQLVGVDNTGQLISSAGTCSDGLSADGRVVFFEPNCGGGSVWARINGTTSIEMSASRCTRTAADPGGVCTGPDDASFAGKAADGSRGFFTTSKQLVNGDVDQTNDLYACDIPAGNPAPDDDPANPCDALTQVSGGATGADVESVYRVSGDGSTVYFLAQGVLAANQGADGVTAVAGDHNLYVWRKDAAHPGGAVTFIARLDDGGLSSATTGDGRYFVFSTSTALIGSGPGADTDTATDVYRYDVGTGALLRLSTSSSGGGGNDSAFSAVQSPAGPMTSDGGRVIFETAEPLSPLDADTASDVYEWHDGEVSRITSGGTGADDVTTDLRAAISASGKDIFFETSRALTGADADTNFDVYSARVDGGFDLTPPPVCDIADDRCSGRSAPPALAGLSSNPGAVAPKVGVAPVFSLRAVSAAQRKQLAVTGRLTLTVTANVAGTVSARATATISGRSLGVGSTRRVMGAAGSVKLTLILAKRARTRLAAAGRLTVRVVVSHSKVALPRSTTLKLTHARAKRRAAVSVAAARRPVVGRARS